MARVVGLIRASTELQVDSPEVQMSQILEGAERLGIKTVSFATEPLGCSGVKTIFCKRPEGRRLWVTLGKGDVLIVAKLDRLGRNTRDVVATVNHFIEHGVRIVILDFIGGQGIDLAGPVGQIIVTVMAACAELEAANISARTKAHVAWAKQQGFATNRHQWGMKKVPTEFKNRLGKTRHRLEWDLDFLALMAKFVHRIRLGEKMPDLIEEFRANHLDWRGKPFLASYDRDGKMYSPNHDQSKSVARRWVKTFIRLLHRGELPAPFGTPGIIKPVDRGLARQYLRWIDKPDFRIPIKRTAKAPKRDDLDRANWTAEDWNRWWQDMHADCSAAEEKDQNVESLKAEITRQVATALPGGASADSL